MLRLADSPAIVVGVGGWGHLSPFLSFGGRTQEPNQLTPSSDKFAPPASACPRRPGGQPPVRLSVQEPATVQTPTPAKRASRRKEGGGYGKSEVFLDALLPWLKSSLKQTMWVLYGEPKACRSLAKKSQVCKLWGPGGGGRGGEAQNGEFIV